MDELDVKAARQSERQRVRGGGGVSDLSAASSSLTRTVTRRHAHKRALPAQRLLLNRLSDILIQMAFIFKSECVKDELLFPFLQESDLISRW